MRTDPSCRAIEANEQVQEEEGMKLEQEKAVRRSKARAVGSWVELD